MPFNEQLTFNSIYVNFDFENKCMLIVPSRKGGEFNGFGEFQRSKIPSNILSVHEISWMS